MVAMLFTVWCREQQFELHAKYSADSPVPQGFEQDIGRFLLGPPKPASSGDKPKLKVPPLANTSIMLQTQVEPVLHV